MPIASIEQLGEMTAHIISDSSPYDETKPVAFAAIAEGTMLHEFVSQAVGEEGWKLPTRDWADALIAGQPSLCEERRICVLLAETYRSGAGSPYCRAIIWDAGNMQEIAVTNAMDHTCVYLIIGE